jgi:FKBP-type peptidyl-prolyl cis-trans isomerase
VPADTPDSFKSEKERRSYALGSFFATREKNQATASNVPPPKADEMVAGVTDVLNGSKSADYAVGAQLAVQIKRAEFDVDPAVLAEAVRDVMTGQTPKLTPQQEQMVMQRVQADLRQRAETKRKAEAEKAMAVATEFLTHNAKAEGVKQTASGLQYIIEKAGEGKSAAEGDLAMLNFKATLTDGTVIEKSPDTGPMRKTVRSLPTRHAQVRRQRKILESSGAGSWRVRQAAAGKGQCRSCL